MFSPRSHFKRFVKNAKQVVNKDVYTKHFAVTKELYLREHLNVIGFNTKPNFGDKAFDTFDTKRLKDHSGLKFPIGGDEAKTFDKEPLNTSKADFDTIFAKDRIYEKAQKRFTKEMGDFNKLFEKLPVKYTAEALISTYEGIHDRARRAINAQQQLELNMLREKLKDDPFLNKLAADLKLSKDSPEFKKVIADLESETQKKHKEQSDEFNKVFQEGKTALTTAANKERDMALLHSLLLHTSNELSEKRRRSLQKHIEDSLALNPPHSKGEALIHQGEDYFTVQALDLDKLEYIRDVTGKEIKIKDGMLTAKFEPPLMSPLHSLSNLLVDKKAARATALTIATALRLKGVEAITMSVDFASEDVAKDKAKEVYRACLEAGYPPEKITLKVNGKVMKPSEVFSKEPRLLQRIEENAASDRKYREEESKKIDEKRLSSSSNKKQVQDIRNELMKGRKDDRTLQQAQAKVEKHDKELQEFETRVKPK